MSSTIKFFFYGVVCEETAFSQIKLILPSYFSKQRGKNAVESLLGKGLFIVAVF